MRHIPGGAKGKDKLQVIGTPEDMAQHVYRFFDGPPDLDPFGMPGQVLRARRIAVLPEHWPRRRLFHRLLTGSPDGRIELVWGNGYSLAWTGNVFGNPPFEDLEAAFTHAAAATAAGAEVLLLVPFRSHRVYWSKAWQAQGICYLKKPVVFLGYPDGFSFPCVFLYFGRDYARFAATFCELGWTQRLTAAPRVARIGAMAKKKSRSGADEAIIAKHLGALLVDLIAANPTLTLYEILKQYPVIEEASTEVLWTTPVGELFGGKRASVQAKVKGTAKTKAKPKAKTKKAPTNGVKAKTKANGVKAKTPTNGTRIAAPDKLTSYLDKLKVGDKFKTATFIDMADVSAQTARKCLNKSERVEKTGDKRTVQWTVLGA